MRPFKKRHYLVLSFILFSSFTYFLLSYISIHDIVYYSVFQAGFVFFDLSPPSSSPFTCPSLSPGTLSGLLMIIFMLHIFYYIPLFLNTSSFLFYIPLSSFIIYAHIYTLICIYTHTCNHQKLKCAMRKNTLISLEYFLIIIISRSTANFKISHLLTSE